jgi:hypothetical protein
MSQVRTGQPAIVARHLLQLHHEVFSQFWRWSDMALDHAMLFGWQSTVFGWRLQVFPNRKLRHEHKASVSAMAFSSDGHNRL